MMSSPHEPKQRHNYSEDHRHLITAGTLGCKYKILTKNIFTATKMDCHQQT